MLYSVQSKYSLRRRDFLASLGAITAAPMLLVQRAAPRKPNIVFILADDLGYGDLNCYNPDSKIPTPKLDVLASEGVRFTDAHTPSAVCSPTRYGLLTGRYCWRSQLKHQVLWPFDEPLLEKGRLTLGGMLQEAGYKTACIGKWHLGWNWPTHDGSRISVAMGESEREKRAQFAAKVDYSRPITGGPIESGFDYYFGDDVPNFPPYTYIENDRVLVQPSQEKPEKMFGWPGAMAPGWRLESVMPELTRRSVNFIEESASEKQPFFLYMPLTAPHEPVAPDDPFLGSSKAGRYGDFVNEVDWSVGQVLDALSKTKADRNTLVIFTSDNGPENPAYPRVREHNHRSMGPWRGVKRMLWEGGHRVPFIARWPGHIRAASGEDEVICLTDMMATFAGILGRALPDNAAEDSYDVGDALFGHRRKQPIREATVHHSYNGRFALRQRDWVYLETAEGGGGQAEPQWWRDENDIPKLDAPAELFNLRQDPAQRRNLYHERPDVAKRLSALLRRYRQENRSVPRRSRS
jgi:arylsulfatase A